MVKDQHKAGIPPKPRGQQTGFAGNPDQNREEMKKNACSAWEDEAQEQDVQR